MFIPIYIILIVIFCILPMLARYNTTTSMITVTINVGIILLILNITFLSNYDTEFIWFIVGLVAAISTVLCVKEPSK